MNDWFNRGRREAMIRGLEEDWQRGDGTPRRWPLSERAQRQLAEARRLEIDSTFEYMQRYVIQNREELLHDNYGYNLLRIQEQNKNVGGYCLVNNRGEFSRRYYLTSGAHGVRTGVVDRSTCVEAKALEAAAGVRSVSQLLIYTYKMPCRYCQEKIRNARRTGAFIVTVKYANGVVYL